MTYQELLLEATNRQDTELFVSSELYIKEGRKCIRIDITTVKTNKLLGKHIKEFSKLSRLSNSQMLEEAYKEFVIDLLESGITWLL